MKEIKRIFWRYKIQILLVLFLILLISKVTYHSDVVNAAKLTEVIINGNFGLVQEGPTGELIYPSFFPPVFHFIDALIYWPLAKFGVYNFDLNNISYERFLSVGFLLKIRYLILFILSLFLVIGISKNYEKNDKNRNKIFLLWLICPLLIFIPFSWGNIDIYPVFLLLLFLLFSFKKKYIWAMLFLGLSAATKNFGLFLIPVASLILSDKKLWKTIFYGLIGLSTYLIPLILYSNVSTTFITGGGEGLFILQKRIFDGPLFFPLVYFLILLVLVVKQEINNFNKNEILVKYSFLTLSCFYLASFFIPHWFLWIVPLFVLTACKNRKLFYLYLILLFTFFINLFSWGRNLDTNLFAVTFPRINNLITINEIISKYFSDFKIFDIVYSLFFASFLAYIYILFFDKEKKNDLTEKEIKVFSLLPLFIYLMICATYVGGMTYLRNKKNVEWYDLGLVSRNEFIEPIVESKSFYQTFESPKDRLKGVNIYFSTYGKKVTSSYQFVLYEDNCKTELRKVNIAVDKIEDNKYREVLFDQIEGSNGKGYCFTVEPMTENVETPVVLNYSKKGSYSMGELILDGENKKDEDIVFQLIYPIK